MTEHSSLYFDLIVSNERKATVSIRTLSSSPAEEGQWWAYEITCLGSPPVRGAVECHSDHPLRVVSAVLGQWAGVDQLIEESVLDT